MYAHLDQTRPGKFAGNHRFFVNRSMTSRVLLLGLPLLTLVLLLVFLATGRSIEALVNRAIARNAQLQAQAMSLSLEQILTETRNQLLILAAGSMDPKDMVRRLQFRVRAEGLRYREVAFMGTDPSQRYLLLSYGGEIISIPPDIASATVGNPFTSLSAASGPDMCRSASRWKWSTPWSRSTIPCKASPCTSSASPRPSMMPRAFSRACSSFPWT